MQWRQLEYPGNISCDRVMDIESRWEKAQHPSMMIIASSRPMVVGDEGCIVSRRSYWHQARRWLLMTAWWMRGVRGVNRAYNWIGIPRITGTISWKATARVLSRYHLLSGYHFYRCATTTSFDYLSTTSRLHLQHGRDHVSLESLNS